MFFPIIHKHKQRSNTQALPWIPSIFETSLGNNFTEPSCPQFFRTFLSNESFIDCYPISSFLCNSQSHINSVRSGFTDVEDLLDDSCAANETRRTDLMLLLGAQLIQSRTCFADYQLHNTLVTQAFNSFLAYDLVRDTTCLALPDVDESYKYFANSTAAVPKTKTHYYYSKTLYIKNYEDSSYAFLYLLSFGSLYPTTSYSLSPFCSKCTNGIMAVFHSQTNNKNLTIISTNDWDLS